jgi:T5SS/PEP-CTERM-associated repeat protein
MSIRNVQSAARIAALALALPAAAGAQTVWTGATGSWFDAGNWSAGVPDASADARIDNTGTCTVASTGAAARSVTIGFDATDSGTLDVDTSATLDVAADLSVGYGGNGALWIGAGSIVNDYSGEIGYTIDSSSGVHGDAVVDGAGTQWNHAFELYVGYGTGTLSITNGASVHDFYGYLGYFPESPGHSSGTATIDGAGSIWTSDANLHIGDGGTGVVTVGDGGTLVNGEGDLGFNFGSDGTATITGAESSWTTNGFLYVGNNGNGTLNVENGGNVSSLGSYSYLSWASASTSEANIDGAGSTWTNANGLYVGFGGTATLTITGGGSMQNGAFANVGFSEGAVGVLSVSGAGSTFGTGGALSIGGNVSGPGGTGYLGVAGGAVTASAINVWNTGQLSLALAASLDAAIVTVDAPFNVSLGGASITGDLVLTPAAAMSIDFDASSTALAISGAATLAGSLTINLDSTVVPGQYTLIEADGGLGGSTFASVSATPPADMTATVTYDGTHVYLVLASTIDLDLVFRDGFDGTP